MLPLFAARQLAYRTIAADNRGLKRATEPPDDTRDTELLALVQKTPRGEKLPNASVLAEKMGWSAHKQTQAMKRLQAAGHVTKRKVGLYERWCRA